jgi:GINS complex subunit 2
MSSSANDNAGGGGVHLAVSSLADDRAFNNYHISSFMAMEVPATIVPRFSMDRVDCLGGSYGPFAPNYPVEVPLWLALYLRQTDTCVIQPPDYLRVEHLRDVIERERVNDHGFESLPFYFYEIAKKLTERGGGGGGSSLTGGASGTDDGDIIPNVVEVIRLVNEIHAMRQQKLRNLMTVFEAEGSPMFIPGVLLTNIVCHELHFLRTSFAVVLQQAATMERERLRVVRLPTVSTLAGRPSSSSAAGGIVGGSSSTSTRTTTTIVTATAASAPTEVSSEVGGDSVLREGVSHSQGSALTTATTATTAMTPGGATQQTDTSAEVTPLVQPPVKKRRTLRQT